MVDSILISQCLQNDFVRPLGPHDPLPNALHVGHAEARRLLGADARVGPVARFMSWAHEHVGERFAVIHLRDWHDALDPLQTDHLRQFGEHCLADSDGAGFVFDLEQRPGIAVVNATTLNDFHDTNLAEVLAPHAQPTARVKVGIVGVWTEAKVSFLAYELRTRYPTFDLAVCSALCASSSRSEHHRALEQLSRILGVTLFSSVGEFSDWLLKERLELPLPGVSDTSPRLMLSGSTPTRADALLHPSEQKLVRYLFRDCQRVDLSILGGGFSGNRVMGGTGTDRDGHQQVPHVVKIGPRASIGRERVHFERIESVLGNSAPQIAEFADFGELGALKYRYASMGGGFSTTFQKQYQAGLAMSELELILQTVFEHQLGRLYAAARRERCNLLRHYGFDSKWADAVGERITELTGVRVEKTGAAGAAPDRALCFPLTSTSSGHGDANGPCLRLYDLYDFYRSRLGQMPSDEREGAYFAFVHGDLNGANIILDAQRNVWLIDFFHTRRAHVLMDLVKLENDLLYIMTPLPDDAALQQALRFTDALLEVNDLTAPLRDLPSTEAGDDWAPVFERAWAVVRRLRGFYPELVRSDRSPLQLLIGQLRYAVHTLSFDECTPRQRRWALYTACSAAARIDEYYSTADVLRVDWLPGEFTSPGAVGLTILPGRRDMKRDLARDLDTLEAEQTSHVLCLLSDDELSDYGVPWAVDAYRQRGFEVHRLPILDQGVSTQAEMQSAVAWMQRAIGAGGRVVVHCVGGLGRSGIAAAALLKETGLDTQRAVEVVRAARSPRAIENPSQERFVAQYNPGSSVG